MNKRLIRGTLAIMSMLVASIVVGGMTVFVGSLIYTWLTTFTSPSIAISAVIATALLAGVALLALGQMALQACFRWPRGAEHVAGNPEQLIAGELLKLFGGNSTRLVLTALGVGFALGLSPRLRRGIYRTFVE